MNWYYKTKLKRIMRFIKRSIPAWINRVLYARKSLDLFEIPKNGYRSITGIWEYQNENAYYGTGDVLRKYSGFVGSIPCTIEHGVYFGKGGTIELEKFNMPAVITFGEYRRKSLRTNTDRPIFEIGPYIQYAEPMRGLVEIKKQIGKTLLVFPTHSVEKNDVDYEIDLFVNFINQIKADTKADTVLVSLYFKDLQKYQPIYEKYGYTVVCAGYRTNKDFLSRQRSFIELSDYVITNGLGTHIGYAVTLKKPVSFFDQEVSLSYESEAVRVAVAPFAQQDEFQNNLMTIKKAFAGFQNIINDEQKEIVRLYWGYGIKLSPYEMYSILEKSAEILKMTKKMGTDYRKLFRLSCTKEFVKQFVER